VNRLALAFAAAAALMAGCGSSGPKPADLPSLENPRPVRLLWSSNVGEGKRYAFAPALVGDSVYAASRATVSRLDSGKGEARWRAELGLKLSGAVGADERTVAVATEEGEVVALDAESGKERWRARVSTEVLAPPALGAGLVLVRTIDNRVFAFGVEDGKRRWVYQRAPASLVVRGAAGMTVAGALAFAGFSGGRLVALALDNGAVRWEASVAVPKGATELERVADVIGEPAVQGSEVCAAAYRARVACFDAASGRQLWTRELAALSAVTLDARYAFVVDEQGAVHALDRTNGQSVWKQDRLAHRALSAPLARGDAVAVADYQGYVHFLARDSGAFITRRETDGAAVRAAPAPLGSALVVQTENGGLFALAL